MAVTMLPTIPELRSVVHEELLAVGGTARSCFADSERLVVRAVLDLARDVRPRDRMQAGVAVLAYGEEVRVHPYTFRQVCTNGAIFSHSIGTCSVQRVSLAAASDAIDDVLVAVREAIHTCSAPHVFTQIHGQLRTAAEVQADVTLHMLPLLSAWPTNIVSRIVPRILRRFSNDEDDSLFGLMNAITSVARDEPDPQLKWDLEELGGGIGAEILHAPTPGGASAGLVTA